MRGFIANCIGVSAVLATVAYSGMSLWASMPLGLLIGAALAFLWGYIGGVIRR